MVPWDDDKSTAADPDNPSANEQLSADEWDAHVADQKGHATRHESGGSDEIGLGNLNLPAGAQIDEESGDFVVRDSAGNVVLRYDEASGAWQLDALEAESINHKRSWTADIADNSLNTWYENKSNAEKEIAVTLRAESAGGYRVAFSVNDSQTPNRNLYQRSENPSTDDENVVTFTVPSGSYWQAETLIGTAGTDVSIFITSEL